ncbi:sigma-70 family RNA polymerase sigma factor [Lentzea tibetensis]|uniref:Sigma-70 family RNA polymerase sigma factor n=1 Tax=Lentzea tibetensis TaxID=2591470 RepID=A0A563EMS4_9PSEU|nr:sigma-70 family RNA polymerase sigma factor [Lentzea tibetensis]TWP48515.1 sigma-70 family RNA polymerase sigma factor [Lentzea tibetensis]
MLGQPDERDVARWRTGDQATMRADLDRALGVDGAEESAHLSSDAELIEAVRGGTIQAYSELYSRHVRAAHNLALHLSRSPVDADDLVSDAFAKVLTTLRAGGGPDSAFRPYLLTAVRHLAYDKFRRDRRLELADDVAALPGAERVTSVPFHDTAVAELDRTLVARAFATLPERWQNVLWHTAIEGQSPGDVAPLFGLTPNGVSAMAHRAREGLRKAYLQAHVADSPSARCRATVDNLGAWTRGGLSRRESAQLDAHLDTCGTCRALATELADVNGALRGVVAPLVLGAGTAGYLAGTAKAGAAVAASTPALLGVGASTTALVIAFAVGMMDAPAPTAIPTTAVAPPPSGTSAGTTTQVRSGSSAPTSTGSATPTTTGGSNTVAPRTTTPAAAPSFVATAPDGFTTSTGGPPTDFPVTIRNTGSAPAPPITLTLSLPDDVKVVGPGNPPAGSVGCPAGKGTVTCTAEQELAAGASVTFVFRLLAGPKASNGTITATTGSTRVDVPVTIVPKK